MESEPPKSVDAADERRRMRKLYGAILAKLRDERGLTQEQASTAARPEMTAQNWARYEGGQAPSITDPIVRRRFLEAIGASEEDFQRELSNPTRANPASARVSRLSRAFEAMPESSRARDDRRQAVFPLSEGEVVISFPADLSPDGVEELKEYFNIFVKGRLKGSTP